ncbi:MAG TPA: hypothetical protein VKX96_04655 [Chloroflexota bacterium]|nr:hypothetical protein [Chloroflexota bacterium]
MGSLNHTEFISTNGRVTSHDGPPYWHDVCGRIVHSEVRLPLPVLTRRPRLPDWTIRYGSGDPRLAIDASLVFRSMVRPVTSRSERLGVEVTAYRDATGLWWHSEAIGAFHVSPDARSVTVWPDARADEGALGVVLTAPIAAFVLYHLNLPALHASAVATEGGAMAFLGSAGRGKSTMAAAFVRRGVPLLADDLLPLEEQPDGVYGQPGLPSMKVWEQTAEHTLGLQPDSLPSLAASMPKKLLSLDGQPTLTREPSRLQRIYLLDRYDPVGTGRETIEIIPLDRRDSLTTILGQISCAPFLRAIDYARYLSLFARLVAQTPVQVLRYPSGFDHQKTVCARLLEDLEKR